MRDISERRRNEERLYRLAHYDHLTQLPNRTLFGETVKSSPASRRKPSHAPPRPRRLQDGQRYRGA